MEQPELDRRIAYKQLNPKRRGSGSWKRYELYKRAKTVREYLAIAEDAFAKKDFDYDLGKEFVRYLKDDEEHPTVEVPDDNAAPAAPPRAAPVPLQRTDVRDRVDVAQPAVLLCERRSILVLGNSSITRDGFHIGGYANIQFMIGDRTVEEPMFIGGGVFVGAEPAEFYAICFASVSADYQELGPDSSVSVAREVFLTCLKVSGTQRNKLETDTMHRIAASSIVGYCSLENSVNQQVRAALNLDKFRLPQFAGLRRVADEIDDFNAKGYLPVEEAAAMSTQVTADALGAAIDARWCDPQRQALPDCVEAKAFDDRIVKLFRDFVCERAPSVVLSDRDFATAVARFPADFSKFLRPTHHPTMTIPGPPPRLERRRERDAARRATFPTAAPARPRAAKKRRKSAPPADWRAQHEAAVLRRKGRTVKVGADEEYWEGAEKGNLKPGRKKGTTMGIDFAPWGQTTKQRETETVVVDENAPPVEQNPAAAALEIERAEKVALAAQLKQAQEENEQLKRDSERYRRALADQAVARFEAEQEYFFFNIKY